MSGKRLRGYVIFPNSHMSSGKYEFEPDSVSYLSYILNK